jgi:hypothetical protein
MFTSEARRLIRKLGTLGILILCLTGIAYTPGATTSSQKPARQICCSMCHGEPTDPGACRYGCNPDC